MSSDARPMVVLPYDLQQNPNDDDEGNQPNPPIENSYEKAVREKMKPRPTINHNDRQTRIIKIALKLAQINGFNDDLNVKREDGTFNTNSNIAKLLSLTQIRVKNVEGMPELIRLLHQAKIDPNYIVNEMVRSRLLELRNTGIVEAEPRRPHTPPPPPPPSPNRSDSPTPSLASTHYRDFDVPDLRPLNTNTPSISGSSARRGSRVRHDFLPSPPPLQDRSGVRRRADDRFEIPEDPVNKKRKSDSWEIPFNED